MNPSHAALKPSRDHVSATARLALETPIVKIEAPTWTTEILSALLLVMGIGTLIAIGHAAVVTAERDHARRDAQFWRSVATAPDSQPTVRLSPGPTGHTCRGFNIDPAWERAIQAECAVMARLLQMARPTP